MELRNWLPIAIKTVNLNVVIIDRVARVEPNNCASFNQFLIDELL
jgi:hypothetical protein